MAKSENGKICAVLAYLLIGLIWYLVDEKVKKDELAKFHVKQGLVLLLFSIIGSFVGGIIPIIGWFIIIPVVHLMVLVFVVLGIINALSGKKNALPIIGGFAKHFKF